MAEVVSIAASRNRKPLTKRRREMRTKNVYGLSQVQLLEKYFVENPNGYLTPATARTVFGIERLASRMYDLRLRGHIVWSESRQDSMGNRYNRYYALV
jgi:hypothetical protein